MMKAISIQWSAFSLKGETGDEPVLELTKAGLMNQVPKVSLPLADS
jgi:hypothetical protein